MEYVCTDLIYNKSWRRYNKWIYFLAYFLHTNTLTHTKKKRKTSFSSFCTQSSSIIRRTCYKDVWAFVFCFKIIPRSAWWLSSNHDMLWNWVFCPLYFSHSHTLSIFLYLTLYKNHALHKFAYLYAWKLL